MASHHLPVEIVDLIFVHACRIPVTPPGTYGHYAGFAGVADIATTSNLMCVARHYYELLLRLLYRAPLLVYPWQLTRLHCTLVHRPALAALIEHLFIGSASMLTCGPSYPALPSDYESVFGLVSGAACPAQHAIEYEAAVLGTLHCARDAVNDTAALEACMHGIVSVRALLAWLEHVVACGARSAVAPSDIPGLEARAPLSLIHISEPTRRS